MVGRFNLKVFRAYQSDIWIIWIIIPVGLVWFICCLAETNRTPFDFAEGESELVSGFNVEYRAGGFALIFIAEYRRILFMSVLYRILFLGRDLLSFFFFLKAAFIRFCFIWVRGTLPRLRYDKLINLAWKGFLPVIINYCVFYIGVKLLYENLRF